VLKRVEDIEQSMALYPSSAPKEGSNPLPLNTKRSSQRSKSSSPINNETDDKASSIVNPGNEEDLAVVLDAAAGTPTLTKRRSASDHKDRRDSSFIRQIDADENDTTIKYHTKAPEQPESLKKIKYKDVLQHLEALLDYEHKYRIKSCMDQIQSRFIINPKQSLSQILTYLSTICTPSTRQEMTTLLTMYSGSLCNVTQVPTATNISYFVHALQENRYAFLNSYPWIQEPLHYAS